MIKNKLSVLVIRTIMSIILLAGIGRVSLIEAIPQLPVIPATVFDVTNFGVLADSSTDNAAKLQKMIDSVSGIGGGVVLFPAASKPYLCGPIHLHSKINLRVEKGARLQIVEYKKYPLTDTVYTHWMTSDSSSDIEISGRGKIDGNGKAWWDAFNANKNMPHRPYMIRLKNCLRLHVHQITLINSPMFHLVTTGKEITIDSLLILAPTSAPNTDGIDPAGENYLIRDDSVSVGDDNLVFKPAIAYCKNIVVKNCHFGTGHGLSIGGQTNFGLDSLFVDSCYWNGTEQGLRLKANRTNGGKVKHLFYSNLFMTKVTNPIYFYSYYQDNTDPFTDAAKAITATTPYWTNIVVKNLTATGASNSIFIEGLPEAPIDSVLFSNVKINGTTGFILANAHNIQLQGVSYNGNTSLSSMISKQKNAVVSIIPTGIINDNPSAMIPVVAPKVVQKMVNIFGQEIPFQRVAAHNSLILNHSDPRWKIVICK